MSRFSASLVRYGRRITIVAAVLVLVACAPARTGPAILVAAPTTGMVAVTAVGAASVRLLYERDGSIVLLRTVTLPPGDAVQSVTWSNDERDVLIATSGRILALDTRTWCLESIPRLAAVARDDAGTVRRR
jgi:hypothetical protein